MKETMEFVNKLQAKLSEANASKLTFESREKAGEDQVALLHRQVLELQAQAEEAPTASSIVAEFEVEFQEMVAQGEEMFI